MFKINLLKNLSKGNLGNFKWDNKPDRWNFLPEGGLEIFAFNKTDFFQDPTNNFGVATAPLFYLDINGDFIAKALTHRGKFKSSMLNGWNKSYGKFNYSII